MNPGKSDIPTETCGTDQTPWRWWQRVVFRIAFLFWALFCSENAGANLILWFLPWLPGKIDGVIYWPLKHLSVWTGQHVFHLYGEAAVFHPSESSDTALNWILNLWILFLALLLGSVWSAVSEARGHRQEYRTLYAWLQLAMRFVVAFAMLRYGFAKVFPEQFRAPLSNRLAETYGNSSPTALLWTFIGASPVYRVFTGLVEVLAGFLLLFRRTSTVGALLGLIAMINVVVLNFTYDVMVKLHSSELLLAVLFLLIPDVAPMVRFFLERREARLTGVWLPRWQTKRLRIASYCLQVLTIGHILYATTVGSWKVWRSGTSVLHGTWMVDGAKGEPAALHWQTVESKDAFYLKADSPDQSKYYRVIILPGSKTLQLVPESWGVVAGPPYAELHWTELQAGTLALSGTWSGKPASVSMHRVDDKKTPLETRGFHWVQESPYDQ